MQPFSLLPLLSVLLTNVYALPPPSNVGSPVLINLRVEGKDSTIFEGPIFTTGKSSISTPSGGSHKCDGTNGGANPKPVGTCTSALVDARLSFDGTWNGGFEDYFITKVGPDAQTATQFWGILRNYQFTPRGGCQQQVSHKDHVLWAFDAFSKAGFLKLEIPGGFLEGDLKVGKNITVKVTDGAAGGKAVADADILDWKQKKVLAKTDATGTAVITSDSFRNNGVSKINFASLKAEKAEYLRSNAVKVFVVGKL